MCTAADSTEQSIGHILSRFKGKREELIPILQAVQGIFGYLPEDALSEVARFISVPESRVYGTATFYSQFYFTRRGRRTIRVCCGTACHVKGATPLLEAFERELGIKDGGTTSDFEYSLERVACVGSCTFAPVVVVDDVVFGHMESKRVKECLATTENGKQ
jgi:NADH-quinone oxidoreductase subunit E